MKRQLFVVLRKKDKNMKRTSPKSKIRSLRLFLIATLTIGALAVLYFSRPASAVNRTWDGGGGADHNWSNPLNWSGDTIPGAGDVAVFDGTSTNDSTIDAGFAGSVAGIQINAGYTGTVTKAAGVTLTVGSSGYSQATGTFTGGNSALDINGTFTLSGGTFNAPSGTLNFSSDVTVAAVATFNPNGGTVGFVGNSQTFIVVPATFTLSNITINKTGGNSLFFNSTSTLVATGMVSLTDGFMNNNG